MKFLRGAGVRVIDLFLKMIEMKDANHLAAKSIDWLFDKAKNEWFDSKEAGEKFFAVAENRDNLLRNPVIKLNFDFLSYLLLSPEEYEAFYEHLKQVLRCFSAVDQKIAGELLRLCKARNYIVRVLQGKKETSITFEVSGEALERLQSLHYLSPEPGGSLSPRWGVCPPKAMDGVSLGGLSPVIALNINEGIAGSIREELEKSPPRIQTVSLLCQKFSIYLKPVNGKDNEL